MLKILQARIQQYVNCELPDVQLVLEKTEEPEIKLPTSIGSSKKQESSRKTSTFALLTMLKLLSETDEELKSLLMKVKGRVEKLAESSTFRKLRSWHPVPSLHGK